MWLHRSFCRWFVCSCKRNIENIEVLATKFKLRGMPDSPTFFFGSNWANENLKRRILLRGWKVFRYPLKTIHSIILDQMIILYSILWISDCINMSLVLPNSCVRRTVLILLLSYHLFPISLLHQEKIIYRQL